MFIGLVTARIVGASAVKHVATTIARRIFGYSFVKTEAVYPDGEASLVVIFGESGLAIDRIGFI